MSEIVHTSILEIKQLQNNMDANCQVGNRWIGLFLQSWTKVLGQIYICGAFSHAPNKQSRANSSTLVQPLPHPPTMLDTCTRYFSRVSTLYWGSGVGGSGGGGGKATHFKTDNSPPLQCWTRVHGNSPEFQHCIGGWGEEATHFKTDNSAFLKLRFKNTEN